jgi:hypothetical protein
VRHWLADLTNEVGAGLEDGSLPPLHWRRVWIDRDDRGRILDWSDPGSGRPSLDPDAVAPDLRSAQRLVYGACNAALLGTSPEAAQDLAPALPLPIPARKLLLSMRDAAHQTTGALMEGVSMVVNAPAVYPKARRAVQIAVCALLPIVTTLVTIGGILYSGNQKTIAAAGLPMTLWATALAVASGTLWIVVPFAFLGALVVRGGFTLRAFGAALVNRRGEPISRLRALWRALVTWSPAMALPFLFFLVKNRSTGSDLNALALILPSLGMALLIAGAVWTALHPSRSIQDRIAGTWLVSR